MEEIKPSTRTSGTQSGAHRFEALDGWRGICATLVGLFHFHTSYPASSWSVLTNAYLYVDFFFVLSGFVIASSYLDRLGSWPDAGRFLVRRLGRLYPLHLFTLLCLVAFQLAQWANGLTRAHPVQVFTGIFSTDTLLSNFLLVHSLHLHDDLSWNIPSWSISTELWTYVTVALAAACLTIRTWAIVLVTTVCALALYLVSPRGMDVSYDYGYLRCVLGFGVGILCFRIHRRWPRAQPSILLASLAEAIMAAACLVFILWAGRSNWSLCAPLVFGLAVLTYAPDAGLLSALLRTPPLRWLGKVSYSIYLNHYVVLAAILPTLLFWATRRLGANLDVGPAMPASQANWLMLGFLAITFAMSAATYRWIEVPGRQWARRWTDRRAGSEQRVASGT